MDCDVQETFESKEAIYGPKLTIHGPIGMCEWFEPTNKAFGCVAVAGEFMLLKSDLLWTATGELDSYSTCMGEAMELRRNLQSARISSHMVHPKLLKWIQRFGDQPGVLSCTH